MNSWIKGGLAAAVLALSAAAAPAFADNTNSASATGTGSVTIYAPLSVSQTQGLDFGTITSGPTSGTVSIAQSNGARTDSGGVGLVGADAGQNGAFSVSGQANGSITVTVAGTISGFGSSGITGSTAATGLPTTLSNTGAATFNVGGTLNIPANTGAGTYSGTYNVTVNYN